MPTDEPVDPSPATPGAADPTARDVPPDPTDALAGEAPAGAVPARTTAHNVPEDRPDGVVSATAPRDNNSAGADDDSGDESGGGDAPVPLGTLEALLLSTHHPLTPARLGELLGARARPLRRAIETLNDQYASTGRSFRIEQVAGGYQILTLPEFGDDLKRLHQKEGDAKLTKAALETLAIIAYKQPILRADIEAIRGVACGETIRSLMEKHLVKIAGRAEEPGRPILYGTTKRFLELFGLNTLKDLPQPEAFMAQNAVGAPSAPPPSAPAALPE